MDSRSVAALNEPPTPSIASEIARVDGNRVVPLKVMCSMKWATPASSGVSRREPARTYAAMETERAPGSLALITRGPPAARFVRTSRPMVQEGSALGRRPGLPVPNRTGIGRIGLGRAAAILPS